MSLQYTSNHRNSPFSPEEMDKLAEQERMAHMRRIEEEDRRQMADWFREQNCNNDQIRDAVQSLQTNFEYLDEKIRANKNDYKSVIQSLTSEVNGLRKDYKSLGAQVLQELRTTRLDIDGFRKHLFAPESNISKAYSPDPWDSPEPSQHYQHNRFGNVREEINGIRKTVEALKREMETFKRDQKLEAQVFQEFVTKELAALRAERTLQNGANTVDCRSSVGSKSASPPTSQKSATKSTSIEKAIIGSWSLLRHRNLSEFCAKNKKYSHEVRTENLKFTIDGTTLTSYYVASNGRLQTLKSKKIGSKTDIKNNRWFIEDNQIVSFELHGHENAIFSEKCVRSLKNDRLVIINSLGGSTCSRVYQRV